MKKIKTQLSKILRKSKIFSVAYFKTNVLFVSFILTSLFSSTLLRYFTTDKFWNFKPFIADLAVLILIGAIGYLIKPQKQFRYFGTWAVVLTIICFANSLYYTNYLSFISLSLVASSLQAIGVADAIWKQILQAKDFLFFIPLIMFFLTNSMLKKRGYYEFVARVEIGRVRVINTAIAGLLLMAFFISTLTGTDISRLNKQWNREYVVMQFGIYIYHINDAIASLKPQISPLFGIDTALKEFRDYYEEIPKEKEVNKYTNIYEGKNVVMIHAESIQNFLINKKFNGVEVTPNLNRLSNEGMYFSNFYSQESVGTSSDSEFTLSTSLLPVSSGTVAVSYWDRKFYSLQNLLKDKGYYRRIYIQN